MCGIAGIFSPTGNLKASQECIARIVAQQTSRGPDCSRVEVVNDSPPLVFGHNRLSIIDLSSAAHQPMASADSRFVVVYNGEIFNFVELRAALEDEGICFRTHSDTEVLIESFRRWGVGALSRFIGMFAFALLDRKEHILLLARDRFGKKPLFMVRRGRELAWASSSRELARHYGLQPSLDALSRGIRFRVFDDVPPLYEGMELVRPGHYLCLDLAGDREVEAFEQRPYYSLHDAVAGLQREVADLAEPETIERVGSLALDAVSCRLRSDVPVGVSLSGGLDSSSVAALAVRGGGHVVGFSFGHPAHGVSEGPVVARLARHLGIKVHFVWPDLDSDGLFSVFLKMMDAQDGPVPTTSMMAQYLVYQEARRQGVKVILGGQGGDEAFMGYRKYQLLAIREAVRKRAYASALGATAYMGLAAWCEGSNLKAYARALPRYLGRSFPTRLALPDARLNMLGDSSRASYHRQMEDFHTFSLPALLRYEDRNSMGNSVESRLPLMDHRLVELGIALPTGLKVRKGYGKWILRKAVASLLPEEIVWARYKRGFDETQGWIKKGLGYRMREYVADHRSIVGDVLVPAGDIGQIYSDRVLRTDAQAFGELSSLIWLIRYRTGA